MLYSNLYHRKLKNILVYLRDICVYYDCSKFLYTSIRKNLKKIRPKTR